MGSDRENIVNHHQTPPLWDLPERDPSASAQSASSGAARSSTKQGGSGAKANARKKNKGQQQPAERNPVARVAVDVPLAHLDRTFDYHVPSTLDKTAVPGCRVRVRFAGQLVDGFLMERGSTTEHQGRLSFLERVVSGEPVLSPELANYARAVADRYGGTLMDVLRLAIPPRHAKTEEEFKEPAAAEDASPCEFERDVWRKYQHGLDLLDALSERRQVHAVWQALPGEQWPSRLAELAVTVFKSGRGCLLIVPDQRDLARLHRACVALAGENAVTALYAGLGPAERYRRWLAVLRGQVRIVLGTRAAMFAPVKEPGLFAVWDDGDDLHSEPRMPYPHVRDVLMLRAHSQQAAMVVAGQVRTAEAQLLVESGWARPVEGTKEALRASMPRVTPVGTEFELARDPAARTARLPSVAFEAVRQAIAQGAPALVQVPRGGYVPVLACAQCRTPARCRRCAGPMAIPSAASSASHSGAEKGMPPQCRWCGVAEAKFRCTACGDNRLRAVVVGAQRTASELGRAFPGVRIRTSSGDQILDTVPAEPAVVVCTPGAEPVASDGYGAALLLDGWALLGRADLRAAEETLRRWMAASALVRPASRGGRVVVSADSSLIPVQALIRWDPAWHAARELEDRRELGFPPAMRMASIEGESQAVARFVEGLSLPEAAELLGPVPLNSPPSQAAGQAEGEYERMLVRVPREKGKELASVLGIAQAARAARREHESIRVQLDPLKIV